MTDSILFWNEVALEANRISHTNGRMEQTGPALSSRALAIVHLAMYDAYAGVAKNSNLPPYMPELPQPEAGASAKAAVATAAHATLSFLFPSQRAFFDSKRADFDALLAEGNTDTNSAGYEFGLIVAQKILDDRKDDPTASADGYVPSSQRGRHRVDPDNPDQGFDAPFYGARSKGFAITKRHELCEPPLFDDKGEYDNEYLEALRQVRGKGIAPELTGTLPDNIEARTVDKTLIGIFWAYDGASGLGTPPRLYNQIVRQVAIAKENTEAQNARLFALVNVAMGDAGILAWDQKYIHDLWRPVVGIREHDKSIGPAATEASNDISDDGDPQWLPLGAPRTNSIGLKNFTPPFPAYPSGHATFGAAALHITRLFYNVSGFAPDNLFAGLDFISDEFNGINRDNRGTVRPRHRRKFNDGLWRMMIENGVSRVYLGVHWIFDAFVVKDNGEIDLSRNIGGVPLGIAIAEDICNSGLKKSTVGPRTITELGRSSTGAT